MNRHIPAISIILPVLLISFPVSVPADEALLIPGAVTAWQDTDVRPVVGVSLKRVALPDEGVVGLGAFELRALYSFIHETYRIDLSWPNLFGFLYPGVSIEGDPGEVTPWVYGELDLFYFPFAFATMMLFDEPRIIPSVYLSIRTDGDESVWETGVRISFPVRVHEE